MTDQEFFFRFFVFMILLIGGPLIFILIGFKKQLDWDGKKSFLVMGPYLLIVMILYSIWVIPPNNIQGWMLRVGLMPFGLLSLYGLARMADVMNNKDKKNK